MRLKVLPMTSFGTSSDVIVGQLPSEEWEILKKPSHEKTEALFSYWEKKRRGDHMPLRSAIDPIEIPHLLPNLGLIEVEKRDKVRFKVRLQGTNAVDVVGEERTGHYIEEVGTDLPEELRRLFVERRHIGCTTVYETQQPMFTRSLRTHPGGSTYFMHNVALPLTTDGTSVSHILCLMIASPAVL